MTALRDRMRPPPLSWRAPITAGLFCATAVVLVLVGIVSLPGPNAQPVDVGVFGPAGAALLGGHWAAIFSDPFIQAGPFELAFWGVSDLLHVHHVLEWQVFVVIASALAAALFCLVVERILRPLTAAWSLTLAATATLLGALTAMLTTSISSGHPAEIAVPLLWLGAGLLARRDRPFTAALLIGLTTGWELWGVLGATVLLLAPRITWRMLWRSILGAVVPIVVIFLPFVLLGPFEMFAFKWMIYPGTLANVLFPHAASFSWPMRLVQAAVSLGAGALAAWFARGRASAIWIVPFATCAVRLFLDPVDADYYRVPPIALALVGMAIAVAELALPAFLATLVLLNLVVDFHQPKALIGALLVLATAGTIAILARVRSMEDTKSPDEAARRTLRATK